MVMQTKCFTRDDLDNLSIGIVDDNAVLRGAVRTVLYAFGCKRIFEAHSGPSALELLKSQPLDLLIVDWKMHPMDGLSLLTEIRGSQNNPNPDIPVIMLTAYDDSEKIKAAKQAGANGFLIKPFNAEDLYLILSNTLQNPSEWAQDNGTNAKLRRHTL